MSELEYSGIFADCYVLSDNRNEAFINNFLNHFIPERMESATEYEFPQYESKTDFVFKNDKELINFLIQKSNSEYSIYWNNTKDEDLKGAMIFFTNENKIIFGLYCNVLTNCKKIESEYFEKLKSYLQSDCGYITYEQLPEMNELEFIRIAKNKS